MTPSLRRLVMAAPFVIGFVLTFWAYWPGIMTGDSQFHLMQARSMVFSDSFPLITTLLWAATNQLWPGEPGFLTLLLILYWGGFALFAWYCAQRSWRAFWIAAALPFMPFLINYAGTLWKDVLVMVSYLVGAGVILVARDRAWRWVAVIPLAVGVAARENSAAAAIPLFALLLWPSFAVFDIRRRLGVTLVASLVIVAGVFAGAQFGLIQILKPIRGYALTPLALYDLTGISLRINRNLVPGSWTPLETDILLHDCYEPKGWDRIWVRCWFVLEHTRAAGTYQTMPQFWLPAIAAHPVAYLQHRAAHVGSLFTTGHSPFVTRGWMAEAKPGEHIPFVENSLYRTVEAAVAFLAPTPLFWSGFWLVLSLGLCLYQGWRLWQRKQFEPDEAMLALSGFLYIAPLAVVGLAPDFRYVYWGIAASCMSLVLMVTRPAQQHNTNRGVIWDCYKPHLGANAAPID